MFGNVGIPSAKGTGTNGYVERALGYLPKDYKPGSYGEIIRQMKANPAPIKRKINDDIILHEEKHKIEVQLYDLKEKYENENKYTPEEIIEKINSERKKLYKLLERREADFMDKNEIKDNKNKLEKKEDENNIDNIDNNINEKVNEILGNKPNNINNDNNESSTKEEEKMDN